MSKFILSVLIFSSFLFVSFSSAQTTTPDFQTVIKQLQDQIKLLNQQIADLQSRLKKTEEEVEIVKIELKFTRSLRKGESSEEVRQLQEFLKQFPDIYPEGLVTGFFGSLTETAVKRFQEKQGIESIGIVGPKTRERLNEFSVSTIPAIPAMPAIPGVSPAVPAIPASPSLPFQPASVSQPVVPAIPATPAIPAVPGVSSAIPAIPATPAQPVSSTASVSYTPTPTPTPSAASTPTNLSVTAPSTNGIILNWTSSNVGVSGYRIYRNGIIIASATMTTGTLYSVDTGTLYYVDSGGSPLTTYTYTVAAYDAAGNTSAQSNSASVTTPARSTFTAYFLFLSTPSGAAVSNINSGFVFCQSTPCTAQVAVPPNSINIQISKTGYSNWTNLVYAYSGDTTIVNATLLVNSPTPTPTPTPIPNTVPITVTSPNGGGTWDVYHYNQSITYLLNGVSRVGLKILKGSQVVYSNSTPITDNSITYLFITPTWDGAPSTYYYSVGSGSDYKIRIFNWDNPAVYDDSDNYFSIPLPDIASPVVSSVLASSITANSAIITWTTDEPANGSVNYGSTTTNWAVTPTNTSYLTSHSFTLSNLAASTLYTFRVYSTDPWGNGPQGFPPNHTFTTLSGGSSMPTPIPTPTPTPTPATTGSVSFSPLNQTTAMANILNALKSILQTLTNLIPK